MANDEAPEIQGAGGPETPTDARTPRWWVLIRETPWSVLDVIALALIISVLSLFIGAVVGDVTNSGWRGTVFRWTYWATSDPAVVLMVLGASMLSWQALRTSRNELLAGNLGAEMSESDFADGLLDESHRAFFICGVAAVLGVTVALATVLFVVASWNADDLGGGVPVSSHVAAIFGSLSIFALAVTPIIVFRHARSIWRDLVYDEEPVDLTIPSS